MLIEFLFEKIQRILDVNSRLINHIHYNQIASMIRDKLWIIKDRRITIEDQMWSLEIKHDRINLYYDDKLVGEADSLNGIQINDESIEVFHKLYLVIINELYKIAFGIDTQ